MKDLAALIIILGLITFGMMITRQHYFENERQLNSDWRERVYGRERSNRPTYSRRELQERRAPVVAATPTPSPTAR